VKAVMNTCVSSKCDNVRDLEVVAKGEDAMNGATLHCFSGSQCTLHCFGDSCLLMADFVCYDGAVCDCDGVHCPEVYRMKKVKGMIYKFESFHPVVIERESVRDLIEWNPPMMILVGSGTAALILFYCFNRSEKEGNSLCL